LKFDDHSVIFDVDAHSAPSHIRGGALSILDAESMKRRRRNDAFFVNRADDDDDDDDDDDCQ